MDYTMEKWKELCIDMELLDREIFTRFKYEGDDVTRDKIDAGKLTKPQLIDWVFNFAKIYQRTKNFNLDAVSKIEDLNSRVVKGHEKIIHLQEDLLTSKDQQLACFRSTVKEEMASVQSAVQHEIRSTWSQVAAGGESGGQTITTAAKLKEAVKSAVAEEDKAKNFMIFGKEEVPSEDVPTIVAGILQDLNEKPRLVECTRVGASGQGKPRPIKVKLSSVDAVFNVLRNAKLLKNSCSNKATYIGPDRSKEERADHNKLVAKMKTMMRNEPDKYHYIRRGAIRSVDKSADFNELSLYE
jgi:hypothetical protein